MKKLLVLLVIGLVVYIVMATMKMYIALGGGGGGGWTMVVKEKLCCWLQKVWDFLEYTPTFWSILCFFMNYELDEGGERRKL